MQSTGACDELRSPQRNGQPLLSGTVRIRRLKLFGHVARVDKSQDHSRALQACISPAPRNWRRRPGRPRHTWLRTVEEDLSEFNLGLALGLRMAENISLEQALIETERVALCLLLFDLGKLMKYCKTLVFCCILISRFLSVQKLRHFNFAFWLIVTAFCLSIFA